MVKALDLFNSVLPNLDAGNLDYYNTLTEQQKKEFSPFIVMKFMSAVRNGNIPRHLIVVNKVVNRDFWELSDYKDLQCSLLALCGSGTTKRHYFPGKQLTDTAIFKFLKECYPFMKIDEIQMLLDINEPDDIFQLAKDFGLQDIELKKIQKNIKDHYGI